MRTIAIVATALVVCATVASAQEKPEDEDTRRFQLFTGCSLVFPVVALEQHSSYAEDLEEAELEQIVHDSLESARLMSDRNVPPLLFISVGVVQWAFSVRVELMKSLRDPYTELRGGATTWRAHRYGVHSGDKSFVLSSLRTALNGFVDEYRRVNERSCPSDDDPAEPRSDPGSPRTEPYILPLQGCALRCSSDE